MSSVSLDLRLEGDRPLCLLLHPFPFLSWKMHETQKLVLSNIDIWRPNSLFIAARGAGRRLR